METNTQERVLKFLRHLPYCRYCLQHDNSYAFLAFFDLGAEDIERIAEPYERYYPAELHQPVFYANGDGYLGIRFFHEQSDDGRTIDATINMRKPSGKLTAKFYLINRELMDNKELPKKERIPRFKFNLAKESGWARLLEEFPQKPLGEKVYKRTGGRAA